MSQLEEEAKRKSVCVCVRERERERERDRDRQTDRQTDRETELVAEEQIRPTFIQLQTLIAVPILQTILITNSDPHRFCLGSRLFHLLTRKEKKKEKSLYINAFV